MIRDLFEASKKVVSQLKPDFHGLLSLAIDGTGLTMPDTQAVRDLRVRLQSEGRAEVRFTAPGDLGGGKVLRYQVKAAALPIVPYERWDFARDAGKKRNWRRAVNCRGEPVSGQAGSQERFHVTGVPSGTELHFAVRSFDDSDNRSRISSLATPEE